MGQQKQIKSKERVAKHGEVFTAEREVKAMCDLVKNESERIDSRILEPACGEGPFLQEMLKRKLETVKTRYGKSPHDFELYSIVALSSLYGVELLEDNAQQCRDILYDLWNKAYSEFSEQRDDVKKAARYMVQTNILCGDALTLKQHDGTPIVFAEWTLLPNGMMLRKDYELSVMLEYRNPENNTKDLFSPNQESERPYIEPTPIAIYKPINYWRVPECQKR